ncbi:MAG: tetratricopeptide repeat protein [Nitrospinae bacterium]|nr:tetratricopeptide repeat protein [Nitrospinota bacterium]
MTENKDKVIALLTDGFMEKHGVREKLAAEGFKVESYSALSGETVEKLAAARPDIIIGDDDPANAADSFHFFKRLKEDPRFKETELFFYTGAIDVKTEISIRRLKITSYFIKSENVGHLVDGVLQHYIQKDLDKDDSRWKKEINDLEIQEAEEARADEASSSYTGDEYTSGQSLENTAEFSDMVDTFHKGIEAKLGTDESSFEAYYNLGISYLEMGLFPQALAEFEKVKSSPAWKLKAVNMIGQTQRKMGEPDKAVETFKAGFKETADTFTKMGFLYEIADTMESQGKNQEAYKAFATIYQQNKEFKDVRSRLITLKNLIESKGKA